tara:strand:+ start:2573 stop:4621 length:2049 start_codon:yes stop_codon:yes gene_type:complete
MSRIQFVNNLEVHGALRLNSVSASISDTTALFLNSSNDVVKRALGSNAFTSVDIPNNISILANAVTETINLQGSGSTQPTLGFSSGFTIAKAGNVVTVTYAGTTGTGTTDYLPIWSDGANGTLGDSVVNQEAGTVYDTTKNLVVDGNIYQKNMYGSVSIGKGALASATTSSGQAFPGENIAVGEDALAGTILGTNNVGIGSVTLKNVTGGSNNVAISKNAGASVVGTGNIGIGFNTLAASYFTTAQGYNAEQNVVIGHLATQNTNTTTRAIAYNVIIGRSALARPNSGNITGSLEENVVIGSNAANGISGSASSSVFIGTESARNHNTTSGSGDIGIGRFAFSGANSGFTSQGNNIAIGVNSNGGQGGSTKESIRIGTAGKAGNYAVSIGSVDTDSYQSNFINAENSAGIGGYSNQTDGNASFLGAGHDNTIASGATGGAVIGGFDNAITGVGSAGMALGSNLRVEGANQVVVGRYNTPNNNTKFIVGAGFSNANRRNALEVLNTSQIRLGRYGQGAGQSGGTPNFPPTASAFGQSVLVTQANNLVYSTPVMGPNGVSSIGEYQPSAGLTATNGGQTFLGINASRFYKCSWSGTTATLPFEVRLPPANATGSNNPGMAQRIIEFFTDTTFNQVSPGQDGSIKFTPSSGETINGSTSGRTMSGSYRSFKFWSDGTEWYIINQL